MRGGEFGIGGKGNMKGGDVRVGGGGEERKMEKGRD